MAAVGLEVSVRCPLVAISRAVIVRASFVVPIARAIPLYIIRYGIFPVMSQRRIVRRSSLK